MTDRPKLRRFEVGLSCRHLVDWACVYAPSLCLQDMFAAEDEQDDDYATQKTGEENNS
jgi:hypothetical protein